MKKTFLLYLIIIGLLFPRCNNKEDKKTKYIIFSASYFSISEITDTNNAVLVTNKDSIAFFEKLFVGNDLESICPCGFNYRLQFFDKEGVSIRNEMYYPLNIYVNNDDIIKKEVEILSSRMHDSPTHYIYNLKIEGSPWLAIKELHSNNYLSFIMDEYFERIGPRPYYTIQLLSTHNQVDIEKELSKFSFIKKVESATDSLDISSIQ